MIHQGKSYEAAISSGIRPHFSGTKRFLEAYILDFNEEIYGKSIRVLLVKKIRDESIFKDDDLLKNQMLLDCSEAKSILRKKENLRFNKDSNGL